MKNRLSKVIPLKQAIGTIDEQNRPWGIPKWPVPFQKRDKFALQIFRRPAHFFNQCIKSFRIIIVFEYRKGTTVPGDIGFNGFCSHPFGNFQGDFI